MALRCQMQLALRRGFITGKEEKLPPDFSMASGLLLHGLLETWGKRVIDGDSVPEEEEAKQLLHDRWGPRMEGVENVPPNVNPDEYIDPMVSTYSKWQGAYSVPEWGTLKAVERKFGFDGEFDLEGVPIGGVIDANSDHYVWDYKTVGARSQYLNQKAFIPLELDFYAAATGIASARYVCAVPERKKIVVVKYESTPESRKTSAMTAAGVLELVRKGGPFLPPPEIGKYPCTPKWCGYFGRVCPYTKHLNREDF